MEVMTVGVLSFAAGVVLGAGVLFWLLPARRQAGQIMRDRTAALKELSAYRDKVDDHFLRTADLVNNLTQSYHAVHEQLSRGAKDLCSEAGHKRAVEKSLDALPAQDNNENVNPPLDYAPSAQGTLAENFGLAKEASKDTTENTDETIAPPRDYAEDVTDDAGKGDKPKAAK